MGLVVYDHGYRIQTPVDSLLPPRVVEKLTEIDAYRGIPESELQLTPSEPPITADSQRAKRKAQQVYQSTKQLNRRGTDRPNLSVDKVMTQPVVSIAEAASTSEAWELMHYRGIQHLAVVDNRQRLVGILTERDLLRRVSPTPHQGPTMYRQDIIGGYSSRLVVATEDTLVRQVALILFARNVSCMPVVHTNGLLAGIVTRSDLLPLIINDKQLSSWA